MNDIEQRRKDFEEGYTAAFRLLEEALERMARPPDKKQDETMELLKGLFRSVTGICKGQQGKAAEMFIMAVSAGRPMPWAEDDSSPGSTYRGRK